MTINLESARYRHEMLRDYRDILKDELKARVKKNPQYSSRAFARDLSLSVSRLSEILSKKGNLSRKSISKVCAALGYTKFESERFSMLFDYTTERDPFRKTTLRHKITSNEEYEKYRLSKELFEVVAEWYYFAILEMTALKGFQSDPLWIARRLEVTPNVVKAAIERLIRLGLMTTKANGNYVAVDDWTLSPDGVSSSAIRKSHDDLLHRALKVLHTRPLTERTMTNLMFSFDPANLEEARALIRDFRRNFKKSLPQSRNNTRLYSLAIQLFPLDVV